MESPRHGDDEVTSTIISSPLAQLQLRGRGGEWCDDLTWQGSEAPVASCELFPVSEGARLSRTLARTYFATLARTYFFPFAHFSPLLFFTLV